jgi:hypothetical protein
MQRIKLNILKHLANILASVPVHGDLLTQPLLKTLKVLRWLISR